MVADEFREYLTYEKRFSVHTVEAYIKDITQFSGYLDDLGIEFLYSVNPQQVRLWVVSLVEDKYESSSLHRKLSSLNTFYKFSIKKGYTTVNPAKGIQLPKQPSRLPKYIEQSNIENLFEHLETNEGDFVSYRNKVVFEILYATGIRRQELLNLKWKDIDTILKQIKILGKGNKERIVPISNELIQLLLSYKNVCNTHFENFDNWGFVILTDKGEMAYPILIYRIVHNRLKEAEIKTQKSPHVLRHTFATHLSNQGAPLNDIKELLGHASLASTQVYTHNSIEKLKEIFKHSHPKA
ncbi:MAG: tyrosine-type recombinase/integrase [Chitinophagales bacterium]|nr:tyrosine-type recombinase/integrase [Chitinophagales bacterium]MCZ2392707.1 tyrosine-type recombinase/integrase [Chitinophagales bacterium]